jgi:hypothetical protein
MSAGRVSDLKVKAEKKFASGVCAALVLCASGALAPSSELCGTWSSVPCQPDPKYDDICDQMWNAVAFWNKRFGKATRGQKRARS